MGQSHAKQPSDEEPGQASCLRPRDRLKLTRDEANNLFLIARRFYEQEDPDAERLRTLAEIEAEIEVV